MSKKGFLPILKYVSEKGDVHYNDVLKYALTNKIVQSRATVTIVLNALTDFGLVDRIISSTRPVRTTYRLNKKGRIILQYLQQIEKEL